ncbi:MAG: hypothetical protein AB7V42_08475 [Thermoleophilia bacterium]
MIPGRLLALIEIALDAQMWCWGRDARHAGGNALPRLGLTRHPGRDAPSAYVAPRRDGGRVVLWSFGMVVEEPGGGGVALRRYAPRLRVCREAVERPAAIATGAALDSLTRPAVEADRDLVARALPAGLRWIAQYERAAVALLGPAWRRRVQAGWPRRVWPPGDAAALWDRLAAAVERAAGRCRERV